MKSKFLFYTLLALLTSCGSANISKIHEIPVPSGDMQAVNMQSKKSKLTEAQKRSWPHSDLFTDSIPGMSLRQAYQFLDGKKSKTIIVGVIDSGIDVSHEDIRDQVWANPIDKPGNNIDEDNNGYVDDTHGWNFLGGEKGEPVYARTNLARMYAPLLNRFSGKELKDIPTGEQDDYKLYLELKKDYDATYSKFISLYEQNKKGLEVMKGVDKQMQEKTGKKDYTLEDLKALPQANEDATISNVIATETNVQGTIAQLENALSTLDVIVNKKYNLNFNGRKTNDNPDNLTDVPYGNPWVIGSSEHESHGSHVAGIMLASRSNNIGVNGVTNDVKLIAVRAIPNGDEHDKDVALAIRYMADKGAKVVNMSFGKDRSSHSEWVYDAIKYAESKDVLLVRAAGNDGLDIDKKQYYPNDSRNNITEISDNVITVGALNPYFDTRLIGDYSNYGIINVDIFAPGSEIYSTVPVNEYGYKQGTSMASPAVAGVAALIRSYYPQLSAKQVKHIILNSGLLVDMEVLVPKSNGEKKMNFREFSKTGRILNAYNAAKMADAMVNK